MHLAHTCPAMSCIYQLFKNTEREPVGFSDVYVTRVDGWVYVRFMDCGISEQLYIYIYIYIYIYMYMYIACTV